MLEASFSGAIAVDKDTEELARVAVLSAIVVVAVGGDGDSTGALDVDESWLRFVVVVAAVIVAVGGAGDAVVDVSAGGAADSFFRNGFLNVTMMYLCTQKANAAV